MTKRQPGRLCRVAVSPMLEGQAPADFHTGREMGAESWDCQPGESDEGRNIRYFNSPQSKAVFAKMPLDAIN